MRSRNIKPGFFKNELLCALPPLNRLLFAGLWCLADRCGRIEERLERIKAELLPYDACKGRGNVDQMLQRLHDAGFILRYSVNGIKYIQIVNFEKHQNPHINEAQSTIQAPYKHGAEHGAEHSTSTVQIGLIPDSLSSDSLNPDSLIPDSRFPIPSSQHSVNSEAVRAGYGKVKKAKSTENDRFRQIFLANLHEDHKNGRISPEELEQSIKNYADYQEAQKQA